MSVSNGPNLGLIISALTGDNFDGDFRKLLRAIDVLLQLAVIDQTHTAPPGSPTNGDRYIVAASPTGAWSGKAKNIAVWTTDNPASPSGVWEFYPPKAGWDVWSLADAALYVYTGSVWAAAGGGGGGGGMTNPMTTLGDLIIGGSSGTPGRLAIGSTGKVLTVVSGAPAWATAGGGGGGAPSGSVVVPMVPAELVTGSSTGWGGLTLCMKLFGGTIVNLCSSWAVGLRIASGTLDINTAVVLRTAKGSTTVIDSTPFTFNGVAGPWSLAAGDVVSDAIGLALDNDHDYYVLLFLPTGGNNTSVALPSCTSGGNNLSISSGTAFTVGGGYFPVDETGVSTIGSVNSPANIYSFIFVRVA